MLHSMNLTKPCWGHKGDGKMLTDLEVIQMVDEALESIWKNEIKADYESGWLLKEDTLKNAMYFHLRNRLGKLFDENDIRIFTEFTDCKFKRSGYRPDMVIAKVDVDSNANYWGDAVTECLAVIELKYKTGFTASEEIYADYDKLQYYVETLGVGSKLYMATIWEYEDDESAWAEEDSSWIKGRVTELNASYKRNADNELQFYVVRH